MNNNFKGPITRFFFYERRLILWKKNVGKEQANFYTIKEDMYYILKKAEMI